MLSSGKKAAVLMVVEEVEVFLVKKGNKEKREGFFLSTFGSLLSLSLSLSFSFSLSLSFLRVVSGLIEGGKGTESKTEKTFCE